MDLHHLLLAGLPAHSGPPRSTDIVRPVTLVRFVPEGDMVGRRSSAKTFNVAARHGGIASRSGRDTDRVNYVRHSAVGAFPHVHHHRGCRLAYSASPEKRERALLALLNVLFSRHCR